MEVTDRRMLAEGVLGSFQARCFARCTHIGLVVEAAFVLELVEFLFFPTVVRCDTFAISLCYLLQLTLILLLYNLTLSLLPALWRHRWLIHRFQLTTREHIHLLPHFILNRLQSLRLDKLLKWINLLLVEQCDEVVAKSAHLAVSMHH